MISISGRSWKENSTIAVAGRRLAISWVISRLLTPGMTQSFTRTSRLKLHGFLQRFRVCAGFAANFRHRMGLEPHAQNSAGLRVVIGDQDSSHISARSNYREV